jgi:peptidyl-prolyl cis-trans isomerase D
MQAIRSISIKIAAALFAVLMILFMVTAVDWRQITGGSKTSVGVINGISVPVRAYQERVQQEIDRVQRQTGRSLSQEDIEQVRDEVWSDLIQQQALSQEYRQRHIDVSSDEIADAIQTSPLPEFLGAAQFKTDNKFDPAKYQRWLQSSEAAAVIPALEPEYAEQIRRSKLLRVVTADVYISDAQLWQEWRDQHETATIELAAVEPRTVVPDSAVPVSEAEARAYYDSHRDGFRRPATAYLSYVEVLRIPNSSDSAVALEHARALRKEIQDGTPFEEVAKRESVDSQTAAAGGELGEFHRGAYDPAFDRVAFSIPLGQVSEPILTSSGYCLLKMESRSGEKAKGRRILIPIEITGAHREALEARADSLEKLGADQIEGAALDTVARTMGLRVGQTDPVQKGTRVQIGLQVVPDAGVWAFQAKPGETGRLVEVSYAYFLFRLDSVVAEGTPPYERIRGAVMLAARNDGKAAKARLIAEDLGKRLAEGSSLAQAAAALKLPHQEFKPFTRVSPPLPSPQIVGAAFGLEPGKTSDLLDTPDGFYFVRVIKRQPADSAEFVKAMEDYRLQELRLARQDRVRNYLAALRDEAKVVDRRAQVFTTEAQAEASQAQSQRSKS